VPPAETGLSSVMVTRLSSATVPDDDGEVEEDEDGDGDGGSSVLRPFLIDGAREAAREVRWDCEAESPTIWTRWSTSRQSASLYSLKGSRLSRSVPENRVALERHQSSRS
jgi:hypothetical protein